MDYTHIMDRMHFTLMILPSPSKTVFGIFCILAIGYHNVGAPMAGLQNPKADEETYDDDSKPWFKPTQQNLTVHPGDRAVLRCRVENLGTKAVTWRKDGDVTPLTIGYFTFSPDTRIQLDHSLRTREWSLIIQAVKPEDEGWYHCQVTTKAEELFYSIKLNVLTVQVTGTEYVEKGNQVQLICNATGKPDPPHNVEWFKDGIKLESNADDGIIITKKIETKVLVSMLVIKQSKLTDGADYICRSSNNDAGSITVHILNVATPNTSKRGTNGRNPATTIHRQLLSYALCVISGTSGLLSFYDTRWTP